MKSILTLITMTLITCAQAQTTFTLEVSADTAAVGELIEVKYILENGADHLEIPDLENLPVISGPNTSSSFMMQNGKTSSSITYSYILKPSEEGVIEIPGASYFSKGETLTVDPVRIIVKDGSNSGKVKQSAKSTSPQSPLQNREKRKF